MKWLQGILALLAVLAALAGGGCAVRDPAQTAAAQTSQAPIRLAEAGMLTYTGIGDDPVTLDGGRYEGAPFVPGAAARRLVTLADESWWEGDLDGDGEREAIVLLTEQAGGSGAFVHLALLGRRGGRLLALDTALIGDRVQIRGLRVVEGEVVIDAIEHGEGDPACCPSWITQRSWALQGDRLVDETRAFRGRVSAAGSEGRRGEMPTATARQGSGSARIAHLRSASPSAPSIR